MIGHLKIVGGLLILLAGIHALFPKYFNWKEELKSLSLINRQMMYIHTFFIALIIFMMGLLSLVAPYMLIQTSFGGHISLALSIFWIIRFAVQHIGYSPKTWKGKPFETTIHILFSLLWLYFSGVYFATYWMN